MSAKEVEISMPQFPAGEEDADMVCRQLAEMSAAEIATLLKLSPSLAVTCLKLAREFPYKSTGYKAIDAYTGVVFRALESPTFTDEMMEFANGRLIIISSLYSLLRPTDTIKPYRLDYTSKAAPKETPMWKWQQKATTERLLVRLKESNAKEILNLMPADACKCVDWKKILPTARVITVNFKELLPGGERKTPQANRLKQLRGMMTRQILEERIETAEQLKDLNHDHFVFDPETSTADSLTFLC